MAVSQGNPAISKDIRDWYSALNTVISNYSNGVATLTLPATHSSILVTNINNYYNKITALKSDKYLKYATASYTQTLTNENAGNLIKPWKTVSFSQVKCKNTATKSNTNKSHQNNSHTFNSNGCSEEATPMFGWYFVFHHFGSFWTNEWVGWDATDFSKSTCQYTTKSHTTKSNGKHSHGGVIDIFNNKTTA